MESDRFGEWSLKRLTHVFEDLQNQDFISSLHDFHSACQNVSHCYVGLSINSLSLLVYDHQKNVIPTRWNS